MWTLEGNEKHSGRIHYLPCGQTLMVSRKEGHILLTDDNSISRQHATFIITHAESNLKNPKELPQVRLKDLGAKYGTYVNDGIDQDKKIVEDRFLMDGDRVRFGMLTNTWRLKYHPLVVTTSALEPASKGDLQNAFLKLGGHIVSEWGAACHYLVMNNITLTIKVVCALAAARPVVTPEFFCILSEAIQSKTSHPDAAQYLPPLQEMSINQSFADFSPKEQRKQVLSGRTFLFSSSKQYKRMGPAVILAGGGAALLSEENYKLVSSTSYLLVQIAVDKIQDAARSQLFLSAKDILKEKGLRAIPESDIGLAILYISTETHCNPSFKVSTILRRNGSSLTEEEGVQIYATETQDASESSISLTSTRIVPETGTSTSRRTPATLPGQSVTLPPSLTSPITLSNSSSTSTNASMLPTVPCNTDVKDGSNLLKNSRKRLRTNTEASDCKQAKRSYKVVSEESSLAEVDPTQPMEELDDYGDNEAENQLEKSKFEPQHHSTQKHISTFKNHLEGDKEDLADMQGNCRSSTVNDVHVENPSLEPTVGRSIPFEPYTLPSLKVEYMNEDNIATQPYEDNIATQLYTGVKEEPASINLEIEPVPLNLHEKNNQNGKRRHEEEITHQTKDDTSVWFGIKKKKTESAEASNVNLKVERKSCDNFATANLRNVKEECDDDDNEDFFAMPSTSGRNRRTAEIKRKNLTGGNRTEEEEIDYFSLPPSSRAERRRKLMKTEGGSRTASNKETVIDSIAVPEKQLDTTTSSEIKTMPKIGNWLSKGSGDVSTVHAEVPLKEEPRNGDVAELSGAFEKSLVVIEVACLVRRKQSVNHSNNNSQTASSIGNLKNFKRFKKQGSEVTSLPKIIGGRDLVSHDIVMSRRDDWFKDNPDVTLMFEERQAQENANNDEIDALFDIPVNSRNRARMRR